MLSLKKLYNLTFYIVLSLSFLIGGILQFLFGVSNTVLMIFLGVVMFTNYVAYVFVKRKVIVNWVLLFFSLYAFTMIISSLINQTNILNTIVYFNFAFLPFSVYYFLKLNKKEGFIKPKPFYNFILFIASIQLPILLIQRNFYNPLINFNNSGQNISSYDFMFGSFLVKSDHSLGCFLLFAIIGLLFNINNVKLYVKNRIFIALYLSLTLFLAESNISKALLVIAWLVFFTYNVYNKIPKSFFNKKFYFVFSLVILSLIAYNVRNIEFITSRLGGTIEENYTIEKSKYFYNEKTAKRLQIIIVAVKFLDTKYIGDGPYSYFDIRTGKFNNTFHFSQVLWSYFDLGLIGLIIALAFMYSLVKSVLSDRKHLIIFIFPISLVYMMYTTVFTEIGILLGLFLIFSLKSNNEFNSNTVPRLEKK
jgi:hypothetical protein